MTDPHPVTERYLKAFEQHLRDLAPADRSEMVQEIRNHIAESVAAGKPVDDVLSTLGSAEELAKAYKVELLVNPKRRRNGHSRLSRFFKVLLVVALGSIPTIVIVAVTGAIGISFVLAGVAMFAAGLAEAAEVLPYWIDLNVPPIVAIITGPVMGVIGFISLIFLVLYIRFLARAIRSLVPGKA